VSLFGNPDLSFLESQFKERDFFIFHKLRGDRPALHSQKFFFNESNVLGGLYNSNFVFPALSLNRDDVVTATFVDSDIKFVDLNLAYVSHGRAEMILQAVSSQPQKGVD